MQVPELVPLAEMPKDSGRKHNPGRPRETAYDALFDQALADNQAIVVRNVTWEDRDNVDVKLRAAASIRGLRLRRKSAMVGNLIYDMYFEVLSEEQVHDADTC
jgi:hypothetical protein